MNPQLVAGMSLLQGGLEDPKFPNGWSRVVASLLAQHSVLLQKLATATLVAPCHQSILTAGPSRFISRPVTTAVQSREVDRRKWRNRRNRHRKKLRRLFYSSRKEEREGDAAAGPGPDHRRALQVEQTFESVISLRETHSTSEAQNHKNARLKEAFGISEFFVEGSSLDPDRKNKEDAARKAFLLQEKEDEKKSSRSHEWNSSPSPSPPSPKRKDKKDKKKKKKRARDRSSSHESTKRRVKSKKSKRSRSMTPKKKKRNRQKKKKSKTKKSSAHPSRSSSSSSSFVQTDEKSHSRRKKQKTTNGKNGSPSSKSKKNSKKTSSVSHVKDVDDLQEVVDNGKKIKSPAIIATSTTIIPTTNIIIEKLDRESSKDKEVSIITPKEIEIKTNTPPSSDKWRDSFNSVKKMTSTDKLYAKKVSSFKVDVRKPTVMNDPSTEPTKSKAEAVSVSSVSRGLISKVTAQTSNGGKAIRQEAKSRVTERSSRLPSRRPSPSRWSDASSRSSSRSTSRSWSRSSMSISPIRKTSSNSRSHRSHSRSRSKSRHWSRSRSRSSSRSHSRSSSRSYSSSSSGRSNRSKRSGKLASLSKYSGSSRSRSSVSRSLSSRSRSSSKSRSPSIPRRKGSPSFLDKRRITSARKRPVPYHRETPPPSPSSTSSDSSCWWSRSPSRSWSRSPS